MESSCQDVGDYRKECKGRMNIEEAFAEIAKAEKRRKYRNRKIVVDGQTFDSQKEANRWQELKLMERAGEIYDLQRQVPFIVIPAQKDEKGKTIERECKYIADFTYKLKGSLVRTVEDTKGLRTKDYIIKRKLMLWRFGLRVKEV